MVENRNTNNIFHYLNAILIECHIPSIFIVSYVMGALKSKDHVDFYHVMSKYTMKRINLEF